MSEPLVLRNDENGVATLTLNRPDKLNVEPVIVCRVQRCIDAIAGDETIGCVIATGAGGSFCAGHDLGAISNEHAHKHFEPETVDALNNSRNRRLRKFVVIVSRVGLNLL